MKELDRLSQLAQHGIEDDSVDEAVADVARRLRAGAANLLQKGKAALNRDTGGVDTDSASKHIGKEIESLANRYLSQANVAGRKVHGDLVRQNVPEEEFDDHMFDALLKQTQDLASKYRGGAAITATGDKAKHEIAVRESPHLVRPYKTPLVVFRVISPLPPANAAKGPYYNLSFDAGLDQRALNLQRMVEKGARPLHPTQVASDGHPDHPEDGVPAAPAPKAPAPKPAPKPAPEPSTPAPAPAVHPAPGTELEFPGSNKKFKLHWTDDAGKTADERVVKILTLLATGTKPADIPLADLRNARRAIGLVAHLELKGKPLVELTQLKTAAGH